MSALQFPALETRIDDYSYQVYTSTDPKFWFRLERDGDRDVITDFSIGSFPVESAGSLLAECYRVLGLTPKVVLFFRDILPSGRLAADPQALAAARDLYTACGTALLRATGSRRVENSLQKRDGKYHLVLVGKS
ncbi:MAG: hypothetical protein ACLQIB_34220 [Isosphaeraceae bacterium]